MSNIDFEPIIGLEIHVELRTNSKMFCGCNADWFGKPPNSLCCPVCLGLPGALPVPNRKAVEWCVMLGLALNCEIPELSKFDRKNYFYPDLPKGYQISQYDQPFCVNGWLEINNPIIQLSLPAQAGNNPIKINTNYPISTNKYQSTNKSRINNEAMKQCNNVTMKRIRIRRVHMEEDTGKLLHTTVDGEKCTLIDFNRSGMPLVEIVTEPDIRSSEEAKVFLKKLHQIIRYLGISDADMEKGSMRLEPNISVREIPNSKFQIPNKSQLSITNDQLPNYKVEVKNINSFNFAKKAIDYEIKRQIEILKRGETPEQETRGWNEKKGITYSQRSKEEAHDYRYFPEPDIPPIRWTSNQLSVIRSQIPELPDQKLERFMKEYGLFLYDATILTETRKVAEYYEKAMKVATKVRPSRNSRSDPKNWIINKRVDITKVSPEELVELIAQQSQKPTVSDEELGKVIKKVFIANPKAVADYKSGKEQVIMFLVGQVMREVKGKGEAGKVKKKLVALLS